MLNRCVKSDIFWPNSAQAIRVYRPYHICKKMKVTCWYKNGSLDALHLFCIQNQDKPISVKLTNRSDPVRGALYTYYLDSSETAYIFLLLSNKVTHPAYYSLEDIESLHIEFNETPSSWADIVNPEAMFSPEIMASRHLAIQSAQWMSGKMERS